MKRAGARTLEQIEPLLEQLRAHPALRERRPGYFCVGRREFLHFHDDERGVYADVRFSRDFVRLSATSSSEQAELLERIGECLSTIETRSTGRRRDEQRSSKRRKSAPFEA
jgi:hypothetical protein